MMVEQMDSGAVAGLWLTRQQDGNQYTSYLVLGPEFTRA